MPDPVMAEIASAIHAVSAAKVFARLSLVGEVAAHMEANKYDATPVFPHTTSDVSAASIDPDATL